MSKISFSPPKFKINPNAKIISDEDRRHESVFSKELLNNLPKQIKVYKDKYEKDRVLKLNVDDARNLYKPYEKDYDFRLKHTPATKNPAGAFIGYLYDLTLYEFQKNRIKGVFVFTAGGTSSGKTTAISNTKALPADTVLVNDSNLADYKTAKMQIEKALNANQVVLVTFIFRDARKALCNALKRAKQDGRTASVKSMAERHTRAIETCKSLIADFKNDPKFEFNSIDNNGEPNETVLHQAERAVAFIEGKSYNEKQLAKELDEILESKYKSGEISKEIYVGFKR